MKKLRFGFTLIEVLIVVAILAILTISLLVSVSKQRTKALDTQAKTDLGRLKIAFEDYYGDNNCYPPAEWFDSVDDCGSSVLSPYLNPLPCDPNTRLPYVYETDPANRCNWYKLYAKLQNPSSDPSSLAQYSPTGSSLGNYGVSSSNTAVTVLFGGPSPSPSPAASTSPLDHFYYCSSIGNCTTKPDNLTCSPTFTNDPFCGSAAHPCQNTVSTCN